jgi:hypothetical protein
MTRRSSLDLLLEINQLERQAQLSHFDSLDTKAGLVLGFSGVLIALGNDAASFLGIASILVAALAAGWAVAAFWPRGFPSIDPTRLGEYAVSDLAFTQLTVVDTLELMVIETGSLLEMKSRRLKWALTTLSAAALLAAADLIQR